MKGSWRDLERWISNQVMGYQIINPYCHDFRHAFLILKKFGRRWSWSLEYNSDRSTYIFTLNGITVTDIEIPKAICQAVFKYLEGYDFQLIPSEYAR
jgi:hypothetical protein